MERKGNRGEEKEGTVRKRREEKCEKGGVTER